MNFILFDDETVRENLLPLTFTRTIADIRVGILTIREKWEHFLKTKTSSETVLYLKKKFPSVHQKGKYNVWINGSVLPTETLVSEIKKLKPNEILQHKNTLIAFNSGEKIIFQPFEKKLIKKESREKIIFQINFLYDIFSKNAEAIEVDFKILTKNKKSQSISKTNKIIASKNIFLEKGASVECAVLNASAGPIYIGKNAEIMEGSLVRGPFALCEHSTLKMGTKIYGATTVGPHSKVGGEVNNSVIFGHSNKAHDGFLGNSVIGEWCNLGADTNNSNLKNNYSEVKLWNYKKADFVNTGLTFCGLIMGDHSKCGINTMFNTGTVVGVSANIFGSGFPPKFIPSFSWGGGNGFTDYKLNTACEVAEKVMQRRGIKFNPIEKNIFSEVFKIEKMNMPIAIKISEIPKYIDIRNIKIEKNKCFINSYRIAKANQDVEIIEGLIIVIEKTKNATAMAHIWNKVGEIYFDVTSEKIWNETVESTDIDDIKYFFIQKIDSNKYTNGDVLEFSETTTENVKAINEKLLSQSK